MNPFSLKGKVVILTGGAGFLGREYKKALKEAGARVITWDIVSGADENVDITSEADVARAVRGVLKKYGRLDVLINNAAMNPAPNSLENKLQFSPYESYPLSLWEKELRVGLTGTFIVTREVAKFMKRKRRGSIINIGSHYGMTAPDNRIYKSGMFKSIGYATTKGAFPNSTRAWSSYMGPYGVRVNCLVLGGVYRGHEEDFVKKYSHRTMLGRMADRREYNGAIIFLASEASSYMTGATLIVDGGWTAGG